MSEEARVNKSEGIDGGQWTWITATDKDSRRRIKSHTSRAVKRRKGPRSKDAREQKPVRNRVLAPRPTESVTGAEVTKLDLIPSPTSLLGAGRVDPFANYPIRLKSDEHLELIDHYMFQAPSLQSKLQKRVCFLPIFQEIRRVSFELANGDPAAFFTILAIASADLSILRDEKDPMQAMMHNTCAIQLLSKRMLDLSDANLDGTIATVALQIIFQLLFENCDSLEPHSDALERLVRLHGGLDSIELSNPQLALLINLADYLPPTVALLGKRRFHLTDPEILDPTTLSPVSLVAPKGLENLAYFDIYIDIKLIFLTVQRTTNAALSGDLRMYSGTAAKFKSQLHELTALGTSTASWSRRCEIMKCVYLSALVFIKIACRKDANTVTIEAVLLLLLTESETLWKGYLQLLIRELICPIPGEVIESLAPLMSHGASMNQQSWYNLRNRLYYLYGRVYSDPPQLPRSEEGDDPEANEMPGLTALFGYFDMDDK